ncbi:MAG: DUF1232 domain-containing protein [Chloroflexota bacterium]|nr:DUF1232 domain-containing protein [Chloroflexota bacterium]
MSRERRPMPVGPGDTNTLAGWLQDVVRQARLAWRLFWDQRVPMWTKLIPPAALTYVLFPIDLVPDAALGLGQLDDIAVLMIGIKLFVELAPPEVVREHLLALGVRVKEWRVVEDERGDPSVVIEGEYALKDAEEPGTEDVEGVL